MAPRKDLTGHVFFNLTVIERDTNSQRKHRTCDYWLCRCSCGNIKSIRSDALTKKGTKSCGCLGRHVRSIPRSKRPEIGQRFGRLTVVTESYENPKYAYFTCRCDCGTEKTIRSSNLTNGQTQSCGCLNKEKSKEFNCKTFTTHGMSHTNEYKMWAGMVSRCHHASNYYFHRYGAKGIYVCDRWRHSFKNFFEDMGPRPSKNHSIDRIDVLGPYSPENCRWASHLTQARNTTKTRFVTIDEVTFCVPEWCELFGVDKGRAHTLVRWGKRKGIQTIDDAINYLYREWKAATL